MALPRTIEQGRAAKAYELAKEGMDKSKDYKNRVKSFPMMVKTNGLGASVAFAKGKDELWQFIFKQIEDYIKANDLFNHFETLNLDGNNTKLDYYLTRIDSAMYRAITNEILALFTWLRRFAEGRSKD